MRATSTSPAEAHGPARFRRSRMDNPPPVAHNNFDRSATPGRYPSGRAGLWPARDGRLPRSARSDSLAHDDAPSHRGRPPRRDPPQCPDPGGRGPRAVRPRGRARPRLPAPAGRGDAVQPARRRQAAPADALPARERSLWRGLDFGTAVGVCARDGPHLFADPRRPAEHGRRRPPPRPTDLPQGVRRGHGDPRGRRPADPGLRDHRPVHEAARGGGRMRASLGRRGRALGDARRADGRPRGRRPRRPDDRGPRSDPCPQDRGSPEGRLEDGRDRGGGRHGEIASLDVLWSCGGPCVPDRRRPARCDGGRGQDGQAGEQGLRAGEVDLPRPLGRRGQPGQGAGPGRGGRGVAGALRRRGTTLRDLAMDLLERDR